MGLLYLYLYIIPYSVIFFKLHLLAAYQKADTSGSVGKADRCGLECMEL
jgi:hypothetical protein